MDLYVKRFHEKVLDYCDLVDEEVLVDICLHAWSISTVSSLKTFPSPAFLN